ncbi:MAG: HAD-IIIA family hydrolase [Planctomycetota bacterium]|nr:HAD-IIIA family hydrolase [Planctomycetota bacterium]
MGGLPAVFLDRDGTLHRELEHAPRTLAQLEFFAGVDESLAQLRQAGFALVLVTNQSSVATGDVSIDELARLNAALIARFQLAGCYFCPHHPERGSPPYVRPCACRKPASGLFEFAARDLGLDLARSWIVGDAVRDVAAGLALGLRAILVATGKGELERQKLPAELAPRTLLEPDIAAAARRILRETAGAQGK